MNINEALEILKRDSPLTYEKCPVLEGMQIIAKNTIGKYINRYTDHDEIWYGNFEETVKEMTKEEVLNLHRLGWFKNEDSWFRYV